MMARSLSDDLAVSAFAIRNRSRTASFQVTGAVLESGAFYSLSHQSLPYTIPPGGAFEYDLTYDGSFSGTETDKITFTFDNWRDIAVNVSATGVIQSETPDDWAPLNIDTILILGASIMNGMAIGGRLQAILDATYPDSGITVIEEAEPGADQSQIADTLETRLNSSSSANTLVVMHGSGNFVSNTRPYSTLNQSEIDGFISDFDTITSGCAARGWEIVYLDLTARNYDGTTLPSNENVGSKPYNDNLIKPYQLQNGSGFCYADGTAYTDFYDLIFSSYGTYLSADGIHPTEAGYDAMRQRFVDSIVKYILTGVVPTRVLASSELETGLEATTIYNATILGDIATPIDSSIISDPMERARWSSAVPLSPGYSTQYVGPDAELGGGDGTRDDPWNLWTLLYGGVYSVSDNTLILGLGGDYMSPRGDPTYMNPDNTPSEDDRILWPARATLPGDAPNMRGIHIRPELGAVMRMDGGPRIRQNTVNGLWFWDMDVTSIAPAHTEGDYYFARDDFRPNDTARGLIKYISVEDLPGVDTSDPDYAASTPFYEDTERFLSQKNSYVRVGPTIDVGAHNAFINVSTFRCSAGLYSWKNAEDALFYGCIAYDNGHDAFDRLHGPGAYAQNETATLRKFIAGIMAGDFSHPFQIYSKNDAGLGGMYGWYNIVFGARDINGKQRLDVQFGINGGTGQTFQYNYIYGHEFESTINDELSLDRQNNTVIYSKLVISIPSYTPTIDAEYPTDTPQEGFVRAASAGYTFTAGDLSGQTVNANERVYHDGTTWQIGPARPTASFTPSVAQEYPSGTHIYTDTYPITGIGSAGYTFTGGDLIGATIYDGQELYFGISGWSIIESDTVENIPTTQRVVIIPNEYDPRRAHMLIINPDRDPVVSVDLGAWASAGESVSVYNAVGYSMAAAPVKSGDYNGSYFNLPMDGADDQEWIDHPWNGGNPDNPADSEDPLDYSTSVREFWAFVLMKE